MPAVVFTVSFVAVERTHVASTCCMIVLANSTWVIACPPQQRSKFWSAQLWNTASSIFSMLFGAPVSTLLPQTEAAKIRKSKLWIFTFNSTESDLENWVAASHIWYGKMPSLRIYWLFRRHRLVSAKILILSEETDCFINKKQIHKDRDKTIPKRFTLRKSPAGFT